MAAFAAKDGRALPEPDKAALSAAMERALAGLGLGKGDLEGVRSALLETMWEDAGILRSREGLARAEGRLAALGRDIADMGTGSAERGYNLAWMDRLNLENLILVSRAIVASALAREDSRGAHFREDFPETSALDTSAFTVAELRGDTISTRMNEVRFTRVRPGESLLKA
jgi:fumarate reductase flavoprotein subunit